MNININLMHFLFVKNKFITVLFTAKQEGQRGLKNSYLHISALLIYMCTSTGLDGCTFAKHDLSL